MKLKSAKVVTVEEKSKQEVERQLVEEHEKKIQEETPAVEKLGREINSFDDTIEYREKEAELPGEVQDYLKFKSETNRGLNDYVKLHEDLTNVSDDDIIKKFYSERDGLSSEDANWQFNKRFGIHEDDEDDDVRAKSIGKTQKAREARDYYNSQREQFRGRLESSNPSLSDEDRSIIDAYKQNKADSDARAADDAKRSDFFVNKTNELFSKFEGFKFNVGDNEVVYKPSDMTGFTPENTGLDSFINNHIDDNGFLKDPEKYHRALDIAKNPEAYAKYFYDQGVASQVKSMEKDGKNINMDVRNASGEVKKGGPRARIVNPDTGNKLRIKQ
jgi:hypothetical protein